MDCWMRPISTRSIPVPMTMMSMRLHELFLSCPAGQSFESHGGVCLQLPAHCVARVQGGQYVSKQVKSVPLPNSRYVLRFFSDRTVVRLTIPGRESGQLMSVPWAMEMKAISIEEPSRLVQTLTGAILGCGGWVLSRGANDSGMVSMLFEFERQAWVDMYSLLVAAGLELSQSGHIRFTELCQCTRSQQHDCGAEIASIDLEIQTFPVQMAHHSHFGEVA